MRSTGENNFLLNGVDNNVNVIDFLNQTSFVIGPSVEAIGDMQVITNGASAEYGRAAGGILDVTSKSGTNQVHGVLFEILQNTDLDANRWENNLAGVARDPFKQNQFGAAVGASDHQEQAIHFRRLSGHAHRHRRRSVENLGYGGFYTIPTATAEPKWAIYLRRIGVPDLRPDDHNLHQRLRARHADRFTGATPVYTRTPMSLATIHTADDGPCRREDWLRSIRLPTDQSPADYPHERLLHRHAR